MQTAPLKPAAAQRAKSEAAPAGEKPTETIQNAAAALSGISAETSQSLGAMTAAAPDQTDVQAKLRAEQLQLRQDQEALRHREQAQTAAPPRSEPADQTIRHDPTDMFVLDLSAQTDERNHQLIIGGVVRNFRFPPLRPIPLPASVAVRFLKNEGFILTDAAGNPRDWAATPRQPHEMGAGEQISLGSNEVIASYEELNIGALRKRALQFGASENAMEAPRETLIEFIKAKTLEAKRQRRNNQGNGDDELDVEEFVPDASMLGDSGPAYAF